MQLVNLFHPANATGEQNFGQFLSMPSKNVVANETKKVDFGP